MRLTVRALLPALSILVLLGAPSGAFATATLVAPVDGAVGSFPTTQFSWALDPGHRPSSLRASQDPTLTAEGRLANQVESVELVNAETSATLADLDAGRWYWQLESSDADLENSHTTPLGEFTIPLTLAFSTSEGYDRLSVGRRNGFVVIEVPSQVNDQLRIHTLVTIKRGATVVARSTSSGVVDNWFDVNAVYKRWYRPTSIRRGTRMTAIATITSAGLRRTMSRTFLAP